MIEAPAEASIVFPVTLDDDTEGTEDLLEIEQVSLADIRPYPKNPRKNDGPPVEKVMASLKAFGWKQPMVLDDDNSIIVGDTRYKAAVGFHEAGVRVRGARYGHAPVIRASDLTDVEIKAYRIADNRVGAESSFDMSLLRGEVMELDELSFDLEPLGFDEHELISLVASDGEQFGENEGENDTPDLKEETVSVAGDLWMLGEHRLLCGDSTNEEDIEALMNGREASLCFTSPPYGVGLDYGSYHDSFDNCRALIRSISPVIFSALKPGGFAVINFGDIVPAKEINGTETPSEYPMALEYWPAFTDAGFLLHSRRIWAKPHAKVLAPWTASSNRAASDWEHLWTFVRPGEYLNTRRNPSYFGVWDTSKEGAVDVGKDKHPAAFPVSIPRNAMVVYSDNGDVVFEPFCGTGTVLIAGESVDRSVCAMEICGSYVDMAVRRWQMFTGKTAILEEDGRSFDEVERQRVLAMRKKGEDEQ